MIYIDCFHLIYQLSSIILNAKKKTSLSKASAPRDFFNNKDIYVQTTDDLNKSLYMIKAYISQSLKNSHIAHPEYVA